MPTAVHMEPCRNLWHCIWDPIGTATGALGFLWETMGMFLEVRGSPSFPNSHGLAIYHEVRWRRVSFQEQYLMAPNRVPSEATASRGSLLDSMVIPARIMMGFCGVPWGVTVSSHHEFMGPHDPPRTPMA